MPPWRIFGPFRRIIEPVFKGVNEFHRSVIKMRVCLFNEAFLPQEEEN